MNAHVTLYGSSVDAIKVELMRPQLHVLGGQVLVELGTLRVYLPQDLARRLVAEITAALPLSMESLRAMEPEAQLAAVVERLPQHAPRPGLGWDVDDVERF